MAERLRPMYCPEDRIGGMLEEYDYCEAMLECSGPRESCIALIYMNGTQEWVYGQCTFKHDPRDRASFKFSNTFQQLRNENVLPTLIRAHAVTAIYTDDPALADRIRTDPVTAKYGGLVTVLARTADGFERPEPPARPSFLSRLGLSRD